jgi:hypothetical protein
VQAAFPPASSVVNRYNVSLRRRGGAPGPGSRSTKQFSIDIVPLSMLNVLTCGKNSKSRATRGQRPSSDRDSGVVQRPHSQCKQIRQRRGARPSYMTRAARPALLALHQPCLWVAITGMTWPLCEIFMPSPPSIYLRTGEVKTASLKTARASRGHGAGRAASGN